MAGPRKSAIRGTMARGAPAPAKSRRDREPLPPGELVANPARPRSMVDHGLERRAALARLFGGEAKGRIPAAGIAAWASVVLGSTCMAFELAISGTTPLEIALPAMLSVHVLIGIGEALITMGALAFIQVARPDLFLLRDARVATLSSPSAPTAPAAA